MGDIVLIADSNDNRRARLKRACSVLGFEYVEALDAFHAMAALGRADFRAVLVAEEKRLLTLRSMFTLARKRHPGVRLFVMLAPGSTAAETGAGLGEDVEFLPGEFTADETALTVRSALDGASAEDISMDDAPPEPPAEDVLMDDVPVDTPPPTAAAPAPVERPAFEDPAITPVPVGDAPPAAQTPADIAHLLEATPVPGEPPRAHAAPVPPPPAGALRSRLESDQEQRALPNPFDIPAPPPAAPALPPLPEMPSFDIATPVPVDAEPALPEMPSFDIATLVPMDAEPVLPPLPEMPSFDITTPAPVETAPAEPVFPPLPEMPSFDVETAPDGPVLPPLPEMPSFDVETVPDAPVLPLLPEAAAVGAPAAAAPLITASGSLLEGSLDDGSGPAVLAAVFTQSLMGRLSVRGGEAEGTVYFLDGQPVWAEDAGGDDAMLARLKTAGKIPAGATLPPGQPGHLLGTLVSAGVIDGETMRQLMLTVVRERLGALCTARTGYYRFTEDKSFREFTPLFTVNPLGLIVGARRAGITPDRLLAEGFELAGRFLVPGPGLKLAAPKLAHFARGVDLVALIDGTLTLEQFCDRSGLGTLMGTLIAMVLADTRLAFLSPTARAPDEAGAALSERVPGPAPADFGELPEVDILLTD